MSPPRGPHRADHYAALHAQTYGEAVDAVTLILHMLEAFIAGDGGIQEGEREQGRAPEADPPMHARIANHPLERTAQRCALFVRAPRPIGNHLRRNTLRFSIATLLCGS